MEVDLFGNAAHDRCMQQYIERPIGLQMIHRSAQHALAMERRGDLTRHPFRFWPLPRRWRAI
ncbi:hypothetical protein JY464_07120, partial [Stenotrophomonas maltophilia]|nr:hypothetical protein [Stenotrophomonas maltophilia]